MIRNIAGLSLIFFNKLNHMQNKQKVWKALKSVLDTKGAGPFSSFLIESTIDRGEKLEQLVRIVERYKIALPLGDDVEFIRKAMFSIIRELE